MGARVPISSRGGSTWRGGARRRLAVAASVLAIGAGLAGCGGGHGSTTNANRTTSTTSYPYPSDPASSIGPASPSTTVAPAAPPTSTPPTTVRHASTPTPPTTSPAAAEQAALRKLVLSLPAHAYAVSSIYRTANLIYVVVARDVTSLSSVIDVDLYRNGAFTPMAGNIGANQNLDPVDPTTIQSANITGSLYPDFLVLLAAGDHDNGVVLSFAGGNWHLLGTEDRTGAAASMELVQPKLVGNHVTQAVNDCNPSCASGSYSITTYGYDAGTGELAATGPAVQQPRP